MPIYTDLASIEGESFDYNAINNAINNILSTQKGSLPGKPTFGSDIAKLLFSQMDHITTAILKNQIETALAIWEPRIFVSKVVISEQPEFNKIVADIHYEYRDKGLDVNEIASVALAV